MSTKYMIDYGEGHELYLEIFEAGKVYLRLARVEFEARPDLVTVAVPLEVWERIRRIPIDGRQCGWDWPDEPMDPPTGPHRPSSPEG